MATNFLTKRVLFCMFHNLTVVCRVTTCLENLEMSGSLTAVREMSGIIISLLAQKHDSQGNVREKILSGKSSLKLFIVSCIFASIQVFSRSLFCVKY